MGLNRKFPVIFRVSRELGSRDGFDRDCLHRQSLPSQESPRPFRTAEKHRKRGLLRTKLLTAAGARIAVWVSLSPVVSKAPDFAILVRNFKRLILNGYSAQEIRTIRIPLAVRATRRSKWGAEIARGFGVSGTALSRRLKPLVAQRQPITVRLRAKPESG